MVVSVVVTMPVVTALRAGVATYKAVDVYKFRQDAKNGDMVLQAGADGSEEPAGGLAILIPGRKPGGFMTYASNGNRVSSALDKEQPLPQLCEKRGVSFEEWEGLIEGIEEILQAAYSTWGYLPLVKYLHQACTRKKVNGIIDDAKQFVAMNEMLARHNLRGELLVADDQQVMNMRVKQENEKLRKPPKMAVALLILPTCDHLTDDVHDVQLIAVDTTHTDLDKENRNTLSASHTQQNCDEQNKPYTFTSADVTHNIPFQARQKQNSATC